jgi:hypothetical protein
LELRACPDALATRPKLSVRVVNCSDFIQIYL